VTPGVPSNPTMLGFCDSPHRCGGCSTGDDTWPAPPSRGGAAWWGTPPSPKAGEIGWDPPARPLQHVPAEREGFVSSRTGATASLPSKIRQKAPWLSKPTARSDSLCSSVTWERAQPSLRTRERSSCRVLGRSPWLRLSSSQASRRAALCRAGCSRG